MSNFYFIVKVAGKVEAAYREIEPCLEMAMFYLQEYAKAVLIEPVEMTDEEYEEVVEKLLNEDYG